MKAAQHPRGVSAHVRAPQLHFLLEPITGEAKKYQDNLLQAAQKMNLLESDHQTLKEFVIANMKYLPNSML